MAGLKLKQQGLTPEGTGKKPVVHLDSNIGVYCILCDELQSVYIGESKNIPNRLRSHMYCLKYGKYTKTNAQWQADYDKLGILNFRSEILEICEVDDLKRRETFYIKQYLADDWFVYNHQLTTVDCTIITCPHEFADIIKQLIKSLERGRVGLNELEHYLHQSEFR